jgi:hypothetical protein
LREDHATVREAINVWRLMRGAAKETNITPAHVRDKDKDDVWRCHN